MPSMSGTPPPVASTAYVKGAFEESLKTNEVYTKAAIDKAVQSLVNANVNLQHELEECQSKLESINIKFINISPFEKFKNLFRSPT